MRASTSRTIYCVGLFLLAACAVIPEREPQVMTPARAVSAPQSLEVRLAEAIRYRIEVEVTLGEKHPDLREARAVESALRDLAFSGHPKQARGELIDALADELSDALAIRGQLTDVSARASADAVILRLTTAINREVHHNRA